MKKIITFVLAVILIFSIAACSSDKKEEADTVATNNNEEAVVEESEETNDETGVVRDLPEGNYEEMGEGSFYLTGPSGSTENGDEIILYPKMDTYPHAFIGIELWDMDGSVETYIYVDGVKMLQEQVGAGYQAAIDFDDDAMWTLTDGEHKVEAVQYTDNDPSKEMTFYRAVTYTVKNS